MSTTEGASVTDPREVLLIQLQRRNDELLLRLKKALNQNKELRNQLKEKREVEEIDDEWSEHNGKQNQGPKQHQRLTRFVTFPRLMNFSATAARN